MQARQRYRNYLQFELYRVRASWMQIHKKGGKKDANTDLQDYLAHAIDFDDQLVDAIDNLDKIRIIFAKELQTLKSELHLINTPLNSTVASEATENMDNWIERKQKEERIKYPPSADAPPPKLAAEKAELTAKPQRCQSVKKSSQWRRTHTNAQTSANNTIIAK